jgi:hypothetical protein
MELGTVVGHHRATRWKRVGLENLLAACAKRIEKGGGLVGLAQNEETEFHPNHLEKYENHFPF